ncbi:MAG: PAS domain S-box protein [Oryzomonas sp.]|uniref:PAS domain S-box protein n=1 Tax=Oryzomonas sp. TaxID=2855186 RepID=UPI0028522B6C|nr:PAS domain S-box protein [Oryzomonas sp.]MDR3578332.1 PAS domain S-box protein [Oryzomonas sp.]
MRDRDPLSILLVDDEEAFRESLASMLALKYPKFRFHTADNGSTGLECFRKYAPDIIITDITMPVMNGMEMAAEIKVLDPGAVIIAISAHSDTNFLLKAIEVGINHYLLKPIDLEKLFAFVDAAGAQIAASHHLRMLNEHNRTLSIAVDQSPACVVITDSLGCIQYVNPRFSELTGYVFDEVLGHNPRIMKSGLTPPETYKALWNTITAGAVWRGHFHNRKKNGDLYWESASISPALDGVGAISHFVAVKEDVTESKQMADEFRRAHGELERMVAQRGEELTRPFDALAKEMAERKMNEEEQAKSQSLLAGIFNSTSDMIWSVDSVTFELMSFNRSFSDYFLTTCNLRISAGMHPEALLPEEFTPRWRNFYQRALKEGPFTIEYETHTKDLTLQLSFNLLTANGTVFGISVFGKDITGLKEAERALRESTAEIHDLYNNAPCGYHSLDRNGLIIRISDTELNWLGYEREEVLGKMNFQEIVTDEGRKQFESIYEQFMARGWVHDLEYDLLRKDGSNMSVLLSATAIYDADGNYLMSRSTLVDITKRKLAEHEMRRSHRLFETLYKVNQAIIRSDTPERLFQTVCDIIIENSGFRMAWVGLLDRETEMVRPVVARGRGTDYLTNIRISAAMVPEGQGPTGTSIRTGKSFISNDFQNDPNTAPWRDNAVKFGFNSSAAFALKSFGEPVGALTIYAREPHYFDRHFRELFERLAEDISFAMDNLEREQLRKEASRELKEAQRVAGSGSWQYYLKSGHVAWSDELYNIHGLDRQAPVPDISQHDRIFTPDSMIKLRAAMTHTIQTGEPYQLDLEIVRPDGTTGWITAHGEAVYDDDGVIRKLRGTSIDITEHRQLEQQLVEAKRLEAIGQLAGGLAHEVRNPLNAILSISEALFKEQGVGDNPEYEPYIQHIRTQVSRLAHLMNDLLELGKPIPSASLAPVCLHEVCVEAIRLLEMSGVAKGHNIILDAPPVQSVPLVLADGVKLQQVLANLLENSLQHSPPGGRVTLRIAGSECGRSDKGVAVIQVGDAGRGIPEKVIGRVFEPFYSGRRGGTGLGLALVKHFIEYMGGTVRIWNNDSAPGCTAEVRIPLAREGQL